MSVAEKLKTIVDNEERVFMSGQFVGEQRGLEMGYQQGLSDGHDYGYADGLATGKKAEYDKFWDVFQQNGTRTNYNYGFANGFSDENFYPKYDIVAPNTSNMFQNATITNLKQRLIDCGVSLDTSGATQLYISFSNSKITHIPEVGGTKVTNIQNCFINAYDLLSIDLLVLSKTANCSCTLAFNNANSLAEIRFSDNIIPVGLNLQWSPLSHDSLMSLINALADKSGSSETWSIVLGADNIAKLTTEELDIMYNKGWSCK
jgi:hypothetical protein